MNGRDVISGDDNDDDDVNDDYDNDGDDDDDNNNNSSVSNYNRPTDRESQNLLIKKVGIGRRSVRPLTCYAIINQRG